jgi:N-acetylglucosaminyl-diphospho-decaprenol L-rhamnosyltransferase
MMASAVVVSYNSAGHLERCLSRLRESCLDRLVVVDNGSTDASVSVAESLADTVITGHGNIGYGAASNLGVASLSSDAALFVNPDCVIEPADIATVVEVLAKHSEIGAVAPSMVYPSGTVGISGGPAPSLAKEWLGAHQVDKCLPARVRAIAGELGRRGYGPRLLQYADPAHFEGLRDMYWVSGYCMAVRLEAFSRVGGFDPRFFLYFEDVDLCKRLAEAGWRVVCVGDAKAIHLESASTSVVGKGSLYGSGLRSYFDKHGNAIERVSARVLARRLA